eukprot:gene8790-33659_t
MPRHEVLLKLRMGLRMSMNGLLKESSMNSCVFDVVMLVQMGEGRLLDGEKGFSVIANAWEGQRVRMDHQKQLANRRNALESASNAHTPLKSNGYPSTSYHTTLTPRVLLFGSSRTADSRHGYCLGISSRCAANANGYWPWIPAVLLLHTNGTALDSSRAADHANVTALDSSRTAAHTNGTALDSSRTADDKAAVQSAGVGYGEDSLANEKYVAREADQVSSPWLAERSEGYSSSSLQKLLDAGRAVRTYAVAVESGWGLIYDSPPCLPAGLPSNQIINTLPYGELARARTPVASPAPIGEGTHKSKDPQEAKGAEVLGKGRGAGEKPGGGEARAMLLRDIPEDVCVVGDFRDYQDKASMNAAEAEAKRVVDLLNEFSLTKSAFAQVNPPTIVDDRRYFACDTEVAFLDVKVESPVGHGTVNCFSIYCGPDVNFNRQDRLWVDIWNEIEKDANGEPIMFQGRVQLKEDHPVIKLFKGFFEDPTVPKVWHNYSFDTHVVGNLGINCNGFAGDTMHMARLLDASRKGKKNYGLASLSSDLSVMSAIMPRKRHQKAGQRRGTAKQTTSVPQSAASDASESSKFNFSVEGQGKKAGQRRGTAKQTAAVPQSAASDASESSEFNISVEVKGKVSMKELFGKGELKIDGTPGKKIFLPGMHELHADPETRPSWIDYSALDAKLHADLETRPSWIDYSALVAKLHADPETSLSWIDY